MEQPPGWISRKLEIMLEFPQRIEQSGIEGQKVSFQRKKWKITKGDKFILNHEFLW